MKRIVMISVLATTGLLAACGGGGERVSRGPADPLQFTPPPAADTGSFSARSALDLLSFS